VTRGHNVKGFVVHASAGNCDGTFIAAATAAAAGTGLIRGHFAVRWGEAGGRGSGGRLGRLGSLHGRAGAISLKSGAARSSQTSRDDRKLRKYLSSCFRKRETQL